MKKKSWKNFIENLMDFFRGWGRVKHSKKKFDYSKFFRDNDIPVIPHLFEVLMDGYFNKNKLFIFV